MPKHDEEILPGWCNYSKYMQHLWWSYKINNQDIERFWKEQEGKCSACRRQLAHPWNRERPKGLKPEVDHKHRFDEAGKEIPCTKEDVRGLLCARCNTLLGKLRDNIDILNGLFMYLKRYKEFEDG
jgi:hypothetical protein